MVRILLKFSEKIIEDPIISQVVLDLKVPINIITAHVDSKGGEVLAEVPEEKLANIVRALRKKGVSVSFPKLIEVDTQKCISCGSCVALCPVDAIAVADDKMIVFDKEKCVGSTCSTCVDACPARAIKSVKNTNSENKNYQ
jgi:L-aspartate semialdehyde sulfurtransferase ferredoxin